jgi:hypothetical protein
VVVVVKRDLGLYKLGDTPLMEIPEARLYAVKRES